MHELERIQRSTRVIKWAEDKICKELVLLAYFGEQKTEWRHNMLFKYVKSCHKEESRSMFSKTTAMKESSNRLKLQ